MGKFLTKLLFCTLVPVGVTVVLPFAVIGIVLAAVIVIPIGWFVIWADT